MKCYTSNEEQQFVEQEIPFIESPKGEMQQVRIYPDKSLRNIL